jgi:hypothetical protein
MRDPANVIFCCSAIAALIGADLGWVLMTGRARSWLGETISRENQPGRYKRYVLEGLVMLASCFSVLWYASP